LTLGVFGAAKWEPEDLKEDEAAAMAGRGLIKDVGDHDTHVKVVWT
jgi:hypothetical protein